MQLKHKIILSTHASQHLKHKELAGCRMLQLWDRSTVVHRPLPGGSGKYERYLSFSDDDIFLSWTKESIHRWGKVKALCCLYPTGASLTHSCPSWRAFNHLDCHKWLFNRPLQSICFCRCTQSWLSSMSTADSSKINVIGKKNGRLLCSASSELKEMSFTVQVDLICRDDKLSKIILRASGYLQQRLSLGE